MADNAAAQKVARLANLTHKAGTTVEYKGGWLIELRSVESCDVVTAKAYRKPIGDSNGNATAAAITAAIDAHALFAHGSDADRAHEAIVKLITEEEKVAKLLAHSGLNRQTEQ